MWKYNPLYYNKYVYLFRRIDPMISTKRFQISLYVCTWDELNLNFWGHLSSRPPHLIEFRGEFIYKEVPRLLSSMVDIDS
jgi:hypothetical protein